jgi:Dopey, N-terminal
LYLPGLAPVLSFAALSVRPLYIRLIETHILALDATALRSPLKSIILCFLPGLEDESSEDYNQLVQLVDKFRAAVRLSTHSEKTSSKEDDAQDSYFWQCFFLATITNASRRQGALSYLTRELPKFADVAPHGDGGIGKSTKKASLSVTAKAALAPEPGLLIRCLAAGLSDSQSLVQRGFLDLLVTHLPLNSSVLQEMVPKSDLDRLMSAAISVVLRRDMSLNRRLWTWLLGPDSKDDQDAEEQTTKESKSPGSELLNNHAAYFGKYGLRSLTRSVLAMFSSSSSSTAERAKPFRLCLSLMDRWEVGGLLIPDIFLPALQSAYTFSKAAEKSFAEDVMKSASQFFDGVESGIIWAKFNQLIDEAFKSNSASDHVRESLDLADFIVFRFNIREEEMITKHIPQSTLFLLAHLKGMVERDHEFESDYSLTLDIVEKLLSLIPSRVFSEHQASSEKDKRRSAFLNMSRTDIISRISTFYVDHHGGLDGNPPPFTAPQLGQLILRESTSLLIQLLVIKPNSSVIEPVVRVVCGLLLRVPHASAITTQLRVFEGLISMLKGSEGDVIDSPIPFRALAAMVALLVTSQSISDGSAFINPIDLKVFQNLAIKQIWSHLTPYSPKHHVEAVRCLWQLEAISPDRKAVEAAITTFMSQDLSMTGSVSIANAARRFAILWTHSTLDKSLPVEKIQKGLARRTNSALWGLGQSVIPSDASNVLSRPLLVLLDHLEDEGTEISIILRSWLQELPTISRVFSIIITKTRSLHCMQPAAIQNGSADTSSNSFVKNEDSRQCLYYIKIFLNILRNASDNTWITLASDTIEQPDENTNGQPNTTLQVLLVQLSLKALNVGARSAENHLTFIRDLHRVSIELILLILQSPYSNPLKELELQNLLLQRLHRGIEGMDPLLHPLLLETITAALKLHINLTPPLPSSPGMPRKTSRDFVSLPPKVTLLKEKAAKESANINIISPPNLLIDCLKSGFQSEKARVVLDSWVLFLVAVIPICTESILQNLIPLVECFCKQITLVFNQLKVTFKPNQTTDEISPESTLITLLDALENILQSAHQRFLGDEGKTNNPRSPDQPQGFFGNMVQGVFTADNQQNSRPSVANSRLTVLLCFQDAVRTCFLIWCWGSYAESTEKQDSLAVASYGYTSLRMRNRARRLLEHLFAAEGLECLETLANIWSTHQTSSFEPQSVLGLLNVLNGSKPKHTIPAIFNAIYSRTNPSCLDPSRQSSLTSELKDVDLVAFLVEYTRTLDDDAMDEIWNDCATFLRDILANPLPHIQILPSLLVFIALLAEKVDNTNFGEQRKTRRELGVSR